MDSPSRVTISGTGLHSGAPCALTLTRSNGGLVFRTPGGDAAVEDLRVLSANRGVRVVAARVGFDVDGIEHLFGALGGLSIRSGLVIEVAGNEVPLADGAGLVFAGHLGALGLPSEPSPLAVLQSGEVRVGASRYIFEPAPSVELHVEVTFDGTAIGTERAGWDGRAESFRSDIAWARTFGFRRDAELLRAAGRARGVDPRSVMVLDDGGRVEPPGVPARPGEFARHKLLDLVGDLYLSGGPPLGRIRTVRPGHAATHQAVRSAVERGLIGPAARKPW